MTSIPLHPERGLNPHLTVCPQCGQDGNEIMLIGSRENVMQCAACKVTIFGHRASEPCPKCKDRGPHSLIRKIEEHEKLPGSICDACRKERDEHRREVRAGGVYFKCSDCGVTGVIKGSSDFAKHVRETHQRQHSAKLEHGLVEGWYTKPIHNVGNDLVYLECGVELSKAECPRCTP